MVDFYNPQQILSYLQNRIEKTKKLHIEISTIAEDDDNALQKIFFSYYFDFATAIEFVIKQILIRKYKDQFVSKKLRIREENFPVFFEAKDIMLIIKEDFPLLYWNEYKFFAIDYYYEMKLKYFSRIPDDSIINIDMFKNAYSNCRNIRNAIANMLILQ